ncbi:MAG: glycosyltransferase family 39 protein [Armatimonadetes bacterium]|nr:glycosyltransferase family 39 protein [Armatimonadota bacterium]
MAQLHSDSSTNTENTAVPGGAGVIPDGTGVTSDGAGFETRPQAAVRIGTIAIIVLMVVLVHLPTFFLPMNRDSGTFAYGGWRILHGGLPYADFWDNKLPGVFYINALAIALFGATTRGLALFQTLYGAATALAFFAVARRFASGRAALVATLLFAFYHGSYGMNEEGNYTESYIALPALIAVLLAVDLSKRRISYPTLFFAGALGAAAGLIKQPVTSVVPAIMLYLIFLHRGRSGCRAAGVVALGAVFVAAVSIAWMSASGILPSAIDANLRFNRLYFIDAYTDGWSSGRWNLMRGLAITALPIAGAAAAIVSGRLRRLSTPIGWLLIPWFALDLAGLAMGGRFYPHYFLSILPSTLLLTAVFMDSLRTRWALLAASAAGLLLMIGPVWRVEGSLPEEKAFPVASAVEREYHAVHWILTRRLREGATLAAEDVAYWIKKRTNPNDMIYVWGYDPRIGFLAQRAFPSRYIHLHPLGVTGFDRDARILELARDIEEHRPKYIVDQSPILPTTAPPLGMPGSPPSWSQFFRLDGYEPVKEVVARHYEPVDVVRNCVIFQLKK